MRESFLRIIHQSKDFGGSKAVGCVGLWSVRVVESDSGGEDNEAI